VEHIKSFLWFLFGYNNSVFDSRVMYHIAGGYMVSHIASLFFKRYYYLLCIVLAVGKEALDHFVFGCGGNEIKHLFDVFGWAAGGLSYYGIVLAKRRRYGYT
jgi:hypothetical protein